MNRTPSSSPPSDPIAGSRWRYGIPAVALHWTVAALIFFLLALGWYMMSVEKEPGSRWYFDLHKSVGLTVLALVLLRSLWRATHPPEGLPDSVPRWQVRASRLVQGALYVVMFAMPILGYLGASNQKRPPLFFGLPTPAWTTPNHDLAEQFFEIHSVLAWVLVALIVLHVAAGLKHLLADHDGVFQRMWPGRRSP